MRFRNKQSKSLSWEKVLTMMLSGKPVPKEDFYTELGDLSYRLSTYIWCIKALEGGVVKVIKDGRKIASYQLMNVDVMQKYMDNRNKAIHDATLKAKPVKVAKIVKAKPVKVAKIVKAKPVKVAKIVKAKPVTKLEDLNATPAIQNDSNEYMEITEIV